jgi:uncharacterized membrane protein YeaQ/YmgE (transglycosylase-associated protein family)
MIVSYRASAGQIITPSCDGHKAITTLSHRSGNHRIPAKYASRAPWLHAVYLAQIALKDARVTLRGVQIQREETAMGILWIIIIGFVAGIVARLLSPGPNKPAGFILTTVLGIVGAFVATYIGQAIGWYRLDQGAGFIGATVGAVIVLFIWNRLVSAGVISDRGARF